MVYVFKGYKKLFLYKQKCIVFVVLTHLELGAITSHH